MSQAYAENRQVIMGLVSARGLGYRDALAARQINVPAEYDDDERAAYLAGYKAGTYRLLNPR
jgi:hypothetical protein